MMWTRYVLVMLAAAVGTALSWGARILVRRWLIRRSVESYMAKRGSDPFPVVPGGRGYRLFSIGKDGEVREGDFLMQENGAVRAAPRLAPEEDIGD